MSYITTFFEVSMNGWMDCRREVGGYKEVHGVECVNKCVCQRQVVMIEARGTQVYKIVFNFLLESFLCDCIKLFLAMSLIYIKTGLRQLPQSKKIGAERGRWQVSWM